ncbi:uroporphyrinogen-III synthase [Chelatococcus asaccharovorans]|uniref:Uroporphyrinogen-III synthase n=1 Tax=Chelatococcus asaccharovorans TaxID=28210 RepID=A0A2V3TW36_9HYPH|nr:uroporphyrinogen-III synthase [Chelatococcus asaccharovorans]MBS7706109.1 uroporphyrinogen-III synthase [Chelatococcus asaccharovorans]PXW52478.1 uroporphyrinogen-III synthase [Chelatococcus asaccharovorans]
MRVLVFRPEAAARRTAARLAVLGHEAVLAPATRIVPLDTPRPEGPFVAIVVGSANSFVIAADDTIRAVPVIAVGERTAEVARARGFTDVESADGDRIAMAALARRRFPGGGRALVLQGRDHKADTTALLADAGLTPVSWIVYAAEAVEALTSEAADALRMEQIDAVLHYSRRSAEVALTLVERANLRRPFFAASQLCLSPDVAEPLLRAGGRRIRVADAPREDALLAALNEA